VRSFHWSCKPRISFYVTSPSPRASFLEIGSCLLHVLSLWGGNKLMVWSVAPDTPSLCIRDRSSLDNSRSRQHIRPLRCVPCPSGAALGTLFGCARSAQGVLWELDLSRTACRLYPYLVRSVAAQKYAAGLSAQPICTLRARWCGSVIQSDCNT
jgi:hypothetical protein